MNCFLKKQLHSTKEVIVGFSRSFSEKLIGWCRSDDEFYKIFFELESKFHI